MNQKQPPYLLVENRSDLSRITDELKIEPVIGVDLEADSMFHYQEKVCLLQISTRSRNILVDPLSLEDLLPLSPVFADPNIRKVFHGADYDIRSLYRDFGIEVHSLFDTQIAARFLGIRETGLASLLEKRFQVHTEKKYQKRDWSERPLPAAMLAYAVRDTCHLLSLSLALERELREKERLFCVEEECELLSRVRPTEPNHNPLFWRFKGARRLTPRSLAILETILQFREKKAVRRDHPPFKILGNRPIMEIAERKPKNIIDFEGIKGLSPRLIKTLGRPLLKEIDNVMNLPEDELPKFPPRKAGQSVDPKVTERIKALKKWREQRAGRMRGDPSIVCTNDQILSLALAHPKTPGYMEKIVGIRRWQVKLFGDEICALLKRIG
ncbi:MAG: HRDC domain-containing protein [Deltaproteobacteria bacterium]|nr:HRDC domain-containing protein [Deltaproteobacteria bacterium]